MHFAWLIWDHVHSLPWTGLSAQRGNRYYYGLKLAWLVVDPCGGRAAVGHREAI